MNLNALVFILSLFIVMESTQTGHLKIRQSLWIPSWMDKAIESIHHATARIAAEKMWNAFTDMGHDSNGNCDSYFQCRGSYEAEKCCGSTGIEVARIISQLREWKSIIPVVDDEASRYGRNGGNCKIKYITLTLGSSDECNIPSSIHKWRT